MIPALISLFAVFLMLAGMWIRSLQSRIEELQKSKALQDEKYPTILSLGRIARSEMNHKIKKIKDEDDFNEGRPA